MASRGPAPAHSRTMLRFGSVLRRSLEAGAVTHPPISPRRVTSSGGLIRACPPLSCNAASQFGCRLRERVHCRLGITERLSSEHIRPHRYASVTAWPGKRMMPDDRRPLVVQVSMYSRASGGPTDLTPRILPEFGLLAAAVDRFAVIDQRRTVRRSPDTARFFSHCLLTDGAESGTLDLTIAFAILRARLCVTRRLLPKKWTLPSRVRSITI